MDILGKEYCTRRGRALEAFRTRAKSRGQPVTSDRPPPRRCGQAGWAAAGRPIFATGEVFRPENLVNHTRGKTGPTTTNMPFKGLSTNPPAPPLPPLSHEMQQPTSQLNSRFDFPRHKRTLLLASLSSVPFGLELNRVLMVF